MRYVLYLYTGYCKKLQAVLKADSETGLQDLIDTANFMQGKLHKDEVIIIYDNNLKKEIKRYEYKNRKRDKNEK